VAGRYATALFEIAKESGNVEKVEADLDALEAAINESADLRAMIASPLYGRVQQGNAIAALAERMELGPEVGNTARLMAANRRLFVLPEMIRQVKALMADARGEITAEVTAATEPSEPQLEALSARLRDAAGRNVKLNVTVDQSLIGGMIVRMGSRMIDTSIRSKLAGLQNMMREVGV
jgi:F-type H+-transporting ATPase subunit delta